MKKYLLMIYCCTVSWIVGAQSESELPARKDVKEKKELIYNFNEEGTHYVRLTFLNQVWARYNQSNPGTTVDGTPKSSTYDIGLRRTRIQLFGQISDRIFFYTQFGQNNLAYNSPRKQGIFFLDGITEFKVVNDYLSIGGGLTAWSGLSRYASPSAGTIMSLDAPLYQQATNDINDQFLRKLSIYAKGKLGKLDYRLAITNPMSVKNSEVQNTDIAQNSLFSSEPGKLQGQGYFMYQFLDKESNLTPYNAGTYLGKKRVFNVGAGFIAQSDAMWHLSGNGLDTVRTNLNLWAVDVFYDAPINAEKGNAITAYASFSSNDYGKNYVRNVGVMNPANGTNAQGSFNGPGSAFPMMGTGNTFYAQAGYLLKKGLLGNLGTLQPYATTQYSKFDLLSDPMLMYEAGVNWLIEGHRAKLSLNYQNRPVFMLNEGGDYEKETRKQMVLLQFQISI